MGSSARSHSTAADLPRGGTLQDALILACPEAADVLRLVDDDDPMPALRAAGFRVVERKSIPADALRFIRGAAVQCGDGRWLALQGGRDRVVLRDRMTSAAFTPAAAMKVIEGTIVEIERPLENESISGTLLRRAAEERGVIVSAVSATVLAPLLALAPAAASMYVFNEVIPNELRGGLALAAIALAAAALFQGWVGLVRLRTLLYVRARLDLGIARRLLARTLRLPFTHLQKFSVSGLMEVFRGLSTARDLLTDRILTAGFDGVMSLLILLVIVFFSPVVALALAAAAVVYLSLSTVLAYRQMRLEREEIVARTTTREKLLDSLRAIATVKSASAEEAMIDRWRSRLGTELLAGRKRQRLVLYSGAMRDSMRQLTTFAVLIAGALLIQSGGARVGSYVAMLQLTGTYIAGVLAIASVIQSVMMAMPHVQQARELSAVPPVPRVRRNARPDRIAIEQVWFRYSDESSWVLRGVDAVIEPGGVYRLDGPSGAGKTTLLRLLATIYKPSRGRLHVNGVDLDRGGSSFLYLPQDVQLFAGSLLDNLRLLSGSASLERIMTAAEELGLAAWVDTLPMRYATLVMSGAAISGGQKQLIALTAAAAADVPVLLLDEAGSNLDAATYRRVFSSRLWEGRTIVYVGHASYAHIPGSQTLSVAAAPS